MLAFVRHTIEVKCQHIIDLLLSLLINCDITKLTLHIQGRMMAVPIFTFSLNHKLLPGRVTIGKYDGTHSCFTAATAADKV
jgi:hypothetical protein